MRARVHRAPCVVVAPVVGVDALPRVVGLAAVGGRGHSLARLLTLASCASSLLPRAGGECDARGFFDPSLLPRRLAHDDDGGNHDGATALGAAAAAAAPFAHLWRAGAAPGHCDTLLALGVRRIAVVGDSLARFLGVALLEHLHGDNTSFCDPRRGVVAIERLTTALSPRGRSHATLDAGVSLRSRVRETGETRFEPARRGLVRREPPGRRRFERASGATRGAREANTGRDVTAAARRRSRITPPSESRRRLALSQRGGLGRHARHATRAV